MSENLQSGELSTTAQPTQNQNSGQQSTPEGFISKTEANSIIHERTKASFDKGYERAKSEYLAQQNTQSQNSANQQIGGMSSPSADEIRQMIADNTQRELQRMQQMGAWQNTAETFVNRIQAAKDKFPDLEKQLVDLGIAENPELVRIANSIDNTAEVLDFLQKNPQQLFMLSAMTENGKSRYALATMQNISSQLKSNSLAGNTQVAPEPLSQITPSTIGKDSGKMTQADYRKMYG